MAVYDEWIRLSARIHGLIKASELASSLFARNNDSFGAMVDLGKVAAAIFADLMGFRSTLDHAGAEVKARIEAADRRSGPMLAEGVANSPEMRQIHIRSALIILASLEAEVSYLVSDHQASIRSRVERAFEHLQRSIAVDEGMRTRWQAAHQAGEVECEKLGAVHLLSHGIWAFKVDAKGARTDLVYQEPLQDLKTATRAADGLVLTEWKKHGSGDVGGLFAAARSQAKAYASGALAGTELAGVRYAVVVSKDLFAVPNDVTEGGKTYRHINIAVAPRTPSKQRELGRP
jgi:hypothetical protein